MERGERWIKVEVGGEEEESEVKERITGKKVRHMRGCRMKETVIDRHDINDSEILHWSKACQRGKDE